ncbi:LysR family transcriptional regulator [Shewanella sp. JM162201]|uniref:LysR family transcriptional regulator n=1 Tax=Shewanella jiangmenensis TaxID=2837387 RepID=A0ABS5V0B1_9GAMM|nr:LysR family transcriptional regulator [Shewanella jiangmenensis]MBT1443315.1 LysR family transcriptional regulator [Shewanella jiangmenensis]
MTQSDALLVGTGFYSETHAHEAQGGSRAPRDFRPAELHQQLPLIYVFRLVAELGSFQAAAQRLSLPRSSVSKKIAALEDFCAERLFARNTRALKLTDAGAALLRATDGLSRLLTETENWLVGQQTSLSGRVKLSCSTLLAAEYLLPRISELRSRYPDISLELDFRDEVVDLLEEGVDIAIRVGKLPDSSLVARKVGEKRLGWYVSPGYLSRRPRPQTPDELGAHDCIVYRNRNLCMDVWRFADENGVITEHRVQAALSSNDGRSVLELALGGAGIIMADSSLVRRYLASGQLVRLFTDWQHPESLPVHLVCLGRSSRSRAAQTLWQHLADWLSEDLA